VCRDQSSSIYIAHKTVVLEEVDEGLPLEVLLSAMGRCAPAPPVAPEPSRFTAGLRWDDTCAKFYFEQCLWKKGEGRWRGGGGERGGRGILKRKDFYHEELKWDLSHVSSQNVHNEHKSDSTFCMNKVYTLTCVPMIDATTGRTEGLAIDL